MLISDLNLVQNLRTRWVIPTPLRLHDLPKDNILRTFCSVSYVTHIS